MIFLKLGGSLITDKASIEQAHTTVIQRLAHEIALAYKAAPHLKLLLGHGSGSFGHRAAQRFGTHEGARTYEDWLGFSEVWAAANHLHRIVLDALRESGLPAVSFPPSSTTITEAGQIKSISFDPIRMSLENNLIPVIYGDVAFDNTLGATIVSTEQVLAHLATHLQPQRLLLAGKAPGVQTDDGELLQEFKSEDLDKTQFHDPDGADVTGGMKTKVLQALDLAANFPDMEILIFSAENAGILLDVLQGGRAGTQILAS
jgi:isopentenyl phosphate kinase